eukprot:TRINITY_DN16855_c0_g1_i1.p1 TRINITY_DN16855_c0_g1~~TRINITY_DN16855_c0_g1_i1.p1  ORF type:complete len:604 (-),score=35.78 TRINITY_DN16855_c0_g1_i1:166-1977(-)
MRLAFRNGLALAIFTALYYMFSSFLPLYNKVTLTMYPFPLTATGIQVFVAAISVWICRGAIGLVKMFQKSDKREPLLPSTESKLHWGHKTMYMVIPSLFFALNIALTNVSIALINIDLHILLRSTSLVWILLANIALTRELPSPIAVISCLILIVGITLTTVTALSKKVLEEGVTAAGIIVTLVSSICEAAQVVFLRLAMEKMEYVIYTAGEYQAELQLKGFVQQNDSSHSHLKTNLLPALEMLGLKLSLSLVLIIPSAGIFEVWLASAFTSPGQHNSALNAFSVFFGSGNTKTMVSVYVYPVLCVTLALLFGMMLTAAFQAIVIRLTMIARSLNLGFLFILRTIPGYILAVIVGGLHHMLHLCDCDPTPINTGGLVPSPMPISVAAFSSSHASPMPAQPPHASYPQPVPSPAAPLPSPPHLQNNHTILPPCPVLHHSLSHTFQNKFWWVHLVGAVLVLGAVIAFATLRYFESKTLNKNVWLRPISPRILRMKKATPGSAHFATNATDSDFDSEEDYDDNVSEGPISSYSGGGRDTPTGPQPQFYPTTTLQPTQLFLDPSPVNPHTNFVQQQLMSGVANVQVQGHGIVGDSNGQYLDTSTALN